MPIIASKVQKVEIMEEGSYPARIYRIIHIGTIPSFEGKLQDKVRITFEFPTEMRVFSEEKGEQPQVLSKEYTLSTHEKSALRKLIVACDPKALKPDDDGFVADYDIENLLGKPCLVSVEHTAKGENTYANIRVETPLPKGMACPPQVNESVSVSYDRFDQNAFDQLPLFIKEKMAQSLEYRKLMEKPGDVPFESDEEIRETPNEEIISLDDIPF